MKKTIVGNQIIRDALRATPNPLMEAISTLSSVSYIAIIAVLPLLQQNKEYPMLALWLAAQRITKEQFEEGPQKGESVLILQRAVALGWYDLCTDLCRELRELPEQQQVHRDVISQIEEVQAIFAWVKERFEP